MKLEEDYLRLWESKHYYPLIKYCIYPEFVQLMFHHLCLTMLPLWFTQNLIL